MSTTSSNVRPRTGRWFGRRGNYSPMMGILIFVVIGFGALSVDVSLMTMANLQCQATADAAAHAALVGFSKDRNSGDANAAAAFIVAKDKVALKSATLDQVQLGQWTFDAATPAFLPESDLTKVNAARARVSRKGPNAVKTLLGGVFGLTQFDVDGVAVAAQRQRAIMLVLDLSCSMMDGDSMSDTSPVAMLRQASDLFYSYVEARPQSGDLFGIATFAEVASRNPDVYGLPWGTNCPAGSAVCEEPWLPLGDIGRPTVQQRIDGICDTAYETPDRICGRTGAVKVQGGFLGDPQDDIGTCTAPHHALTQAVNELLDKASPRYYRAILFMSDGLPNCGSQADANAAAFIAGQNDITIYGVTVSKNGNDPDFVQGLVDLGADDGFNQVADDAAALPVMFEEVARRLPTVFTD
ncbi:MAG: TadG family pilus assembly protein [Myxococcota bacterium]